MLVEGLPGLDPGRCRPAHDELLLQYAAYRKRQARGLVRLLPREAIRPLCRRALAQGFRDLRPADPLAALVSYCETLLPLPPFETWREDLAEHPVAHLHDLDDSAEAPTAASPATVEARALDLEGEPWLVYLRSFRDCGIWRGYIAFEDPGSSRVQRTALIFRESDPVDLRERFLGLGPAALEAFLRSTLP